LSQLSVSVLGALSVGSALAADLPVVEHHQLGHPLPHESAAQEDAAPETWNVHGQYTNVTQWNRRFRSPRAVIDDQKTFLPTPQRESTNDATLFVGVRLGANTEVYVNPEID